MKSKQKIMESETPSASDQTLLSPASKPKKTRSSKSMAQEANLSQNGSETFPETSQKFSSEPESASSSKRKSVSAMPVPKLRKSPDRALEALKRLKISQEDLASVPPLTAMLKKDARDVGGLKAVMEAMRFSSHDPDIKEFLDKYDSIPAGDRDRIPWEAIALAADVNVSHLLGAMHIAVQKYSASRVKFIISMGHPLIAASRIKFGQLASGEKDRNAVDMMTGAIPSPKGPTFIGKAVFGGKSKDDDDDDDDSGVEVGFTKDDDLNELFPDSENIQQKLISIRQKQLENK